MAESLESLVVKGKQKMSSSHVVICALIRDGEEALKRNISRVDELAKFFKKCDVVIVENDSQDGTKEALKKWRSEHDFIHLIMQDFGSSTIPKKLPSAHPKAKYFGFLRIEKMAKYRNLYMDYIAAHLSPDYVMMIDLDIHDFKLDGVCSSFGYDNWHAISAYGKKLTPRNIITPYYFDTYALLEKGEKLPMRYPQMIKKQKEYSSLKKGGELVSVRSAFNGMCIYPWSAIENIRYRATANDDEIVSCLCEHVDFHLQMERNGFDQHFINPSMELLYEKADLGFFIKKVKNRLF
ncbi:MAG: hypothetical protein RIC95_00675 [Vicingaceae bacterium]